MTELILDRYGETVEGVLGHSFRDRRYLLNAFTRRSFWHENQDTCRCHNERMEFLGDAVLGLVIAEILYKQFPRCEEGDLQKKRASLVNRAALARLMRQLDLARFIRMGRGDEMSGCRDRDSILADTLEAIVAAVFLDGGYEAAKKMIEKHWYPCIKGCDTRTGTCDYKSMLQERVQAQLGITPRYELVDQWGEDHSKAFKVAVLFGEDIAGQGVGKNKKAAAQNAARHALESMTAHAG